MADADRIAARLPALPLFADLPAGRLRDVARQVGIVLYTSDEALCETGGPEGPMFVIIEGTAVVRIAGREEPIATVGAGDFVGEITALYGGPRTASVLTQGALEALAFAPSLVRALAREFRWFREAIEESAREHLTVTLPLIAPMLRKIDPAMRSELFAKFEVKTIDEGMLLLTEGEVADSLYIVGGGECELYGGEFGARRTHHARAGDALGVSSLVTGEPSGVTARASRGMIVAQLSRAQFQEAATEHTEWADALSDVASPGRGVVC
jgi:CRP-like cAMP-binding protein